MVTLLDSRLEQRDDSRSSAYRFNLRHSSLGPLKKRKYLTLRDPDSAGWPEKGETTRDELTAKLWIRSHYADWVLTQLGDADPGTVAAAADQFLTALEDKLGSDHNTVRNRRSAIERHIKPGIGHLQLDRLDRDQVRLFLENLTVTVARDRTKRAAPRTADNVRDALNAIWEQKHKGAKAPPWAGLRLPRDDERLARRAAIIAGEVGVGLKPRAYTPEGLKRAMVAAMWYDRYAIELLPNVASKNVPNTAGMIACLVCCAMRVGELALWRWHHIHANEGSVWVPGIKNESAARWAPYQRSLAPWLRWMKVDRECRGYPVEDDHYVAAATWILRPDPSPDPDAPRGYLPAGRNTYDRRVSLAQILAGLKVPQSSTHAFRKTHITWAEKGAPVPAEVLKEYFGHSAPYGKTTSEYVDRRAPFIPEAHRNYIQIPTPEEIAALVPEFKPSVSLKEARELYKARRNLA